MKTQFVLLPLLIFGTCAYAQAVPDGTAGAKFQYEVPVKPELSAYAQFEVQGGSVSVDADGKYTISFNMPDDLVGTTPVQVVMTQTEPVQADGTIALEGPLGSSQCVTQATGYSCNIQYTGSTHYGIGLAAHLLVTDPRHYIKRLEVARSYERDPIGILKITF